MKHPPPRATVLKFPGGKRSFGKALQANGMLNWPAVAGSATPTHPGYTAVVHPAMFDRLLLDIDDLGSAIVSDLSIRAKPVVAQMFDLLIWCNGLDTVQVYEPSSGNVYDLGIAAPSAAPGLADTAGAGSFAGEFTYWIRWKNNTTGQYSALSESASHTCSGSNDGVDVTWTDPSITGVDKAEIFRSKNKGQGIYLIGSADVTAETWKDTVLDSAVDITAVPPPKPAPGSGDTSTIPIFDAILPYNGRLWGIVASTGKLHWSEQNAPWLFPATNAVTVGGQDRDVLTGFGIVNEAMTIFKARHTYYLANLDFMGEGDSVLVPDIRLIDDSTGAASQHAITAVENSLFFLSGEGKVYRTGGGQIATETGRALERTLARLHTKRLAQAEIGYAEHFRKVFLSVSVDEAVHNNETLVYDLKTDNWQTADLMAESFHEFRDTDGRGHLCFGNVRGDLCQIGVGNGYGARLGTLSGSPTAATKNTLTDSGASFDSGVVGLPIALFDAQWNLLQTNKIASRDSATALTTVWRWNTIPATDYYYVIGGMFPRWKFGWIDLMEHTVLQQIRLTWVPTSGKAGIFIGVDDGPLDLVDSLSLTGAGHYEAWPALGGKRFQLEVAAFDGAAEFALLTVEMDFDDPGEGGF